MCTLLRASRFTIRFKKSVEEQFRAGNAAPGNYLHVYLNAPVGIGHLLIGLRPVGVLGSLIGNIPGFRMTRNRPIKRRFSPR